MFTPSKDKLSMTASTMQPRFPLAALFSLVVPGAGQFLLGKRQRGSAIFLVTLVLAFLINWALVSFKVGTIQVGGQTTSWLWSLFVLYWLWNIADALRLAGGHSGYAMPGFVIA